MKNGKAKKWLALGLAIILLLPLLLPQFVFAEEAAAVSEAAPAPVEKPVEAPKEAPAPEKKEAPQPPTVEEAPKPTATPEPTPTLEPTAEPEVTPEPEITPAPEITSESESTLEPELTIAPEITADPEATIIPEISMEPDPSEEPTPTPEPLPPSFRLLDRSKSHSNNHLDAGSLSIPENGMPIPLIYQSRYTRAVCEVDGASKSAASSGCGAAAASMIIAYAGDFDQTPYSLFYWAAKNGRYSGDGLDYATLRDMLSRHGVDSRMMGVSAENILRALRENHPIILLMGEGHFTNDGHYIVLRGLDANGKLLVNDPNSASRSGGAYSMDLICGQAKRAEMLVAYVHADAQEMEIAPASPTIAPTAEALPPAQSETPKPAEPAETVESVESAEPAEIAEPSLLDAPFEAWWAQVSVDCVKLRDAAGQRGEVCALANLGARMQVVEEKALPSGTIWCGVLYQNQKLYLRKDMLIAADAIEAAEAASSPPYDAQITRENVNLRAEAGLEGAVIATAPMGTAVRAMDQTTAADGSIWIAVEYQNQMLYVRSDMIAPQN